MSKIEEALEKFRADRGGEVTPTSRGSGVDVSAQQIARMDAERKLDTRELEAKGFIHADMEDPRIPNAFRHLRTSLLQRTAGRNFVLMVTSVTQGGGATFVARNLGAAFALDETKTALVLDCNLRHPTLSDISVGPESANGLTDYLIDTELQVQQIIQPTGIPRLRVIAAGQRREAAMEFFTAPQLRRLMDDLRARYSDRYLIVDAPPISEEADARILLALCDLVVLVVPYGRVSKDQVDAAVQAIPSERLAGCVFNGDPGLPFGAGRHLPSR